MNEYEFIFIYHIFFGICKQCVCVCVCVSICLFILIYVKKHKNIEERINLCWPNKWKIFASIWIESSDIISM